MHLPIDQMSASGASLPEIMNDSSSQRVVRTILNDANGPMELCSDDIEIAV